MTSNVFWRVAIEQKAALGYHEIVNTSSIHLKKASGDYFDNVASALSRALLHSRIEPEHRHGISLYCFEQVPSTMDIGRALLENKLEGYSLLEENVPSIIVSREQVSGHGRNNRSWASEKDKGVYVTYLIPSVPTPKYLAGLSLTVGIAASRVAQSFGIAANLKWPNDILVKNPPSGKLAGVLTETISRGEKSQILIGVGFNVKRSEKTREQGGVSLGDILEKETSVFQVLENLSTEILSLLPHHLDRGFEPFVDEWNQRSLMEGVRIRIFKGDESITGTAESVDSSGALLLRRGDGGLEQIVSGEVEFIDASCH